MNADMRSTSHLTLDEAELVAEVFGMLGDVTRVRILWELLDSERSVNELADLLDRPASGISQHLAKLRLARLVQTRREGTQVFYRVDSTHVRRLIQDAVFNAEHAGPGIPGHHATDVSPMRRRAAGS